MLVENHPGAEAQLLRRLSLKSHHVLPCSLLPKDKGKCPLYECVLIQPSQQPYEARACLLPCVNEETEAVITEQLARGWRTGEWPAGLQAQAGWL